MSIERLATATPAASAATSTIGAPNAATEGRSRARRDRPTAPAAPTTVVTVAERITAYASGPTGHRPHGTSVVGETTATQTVERSVVAVSSVVGWTIRILVGAFLVLLGIFSLPLVALVFDEAGQEGWIIPVQVVVMTLVGAAVGYALPLLAGEGAARSRGALVGVVTTLVGVALGLVMYFILLSGFDSM